MRKDTVSRPILQPYKHVHKMCGWRCVVAPQSHYVIYIYIFNIAVIDTLCRYNVQHGRHLLNLLYGHLHPHILCTCLYGRSIGRETVSFLMFLCIYMML